MSIEEYTDFNIKNGVLVSFEGVCENLQMPDGVTEIGERAFKKGKLIRRVFIPDGVEVIDEYAFSGCEWLEKVRLPESLKRIEYSAFRGCKSLEIINFPQSLEYVCEDAFYNTAWLKRAKKNDVYINDIFYHHFEKQNEVQVKDGTRIIAPEVFYNKNGNPPNTWLIEKIILPDSLEIIGYEAFRGAENLIEIEIPNSVKSIGSGVFSHTGLKEIKLPDSIKTIGRYVFAHSDLNQIDFPKGIDIIPEGMFESCMSLTEIEIPEGVKILGRNVFIYCRNLKEVALPNSLEVIDFQAFAFCESLKKIVIPGNIKEIPNFAFEKSGLEEVVFEGSLSDINSRIPGSCSPFYGCKSLKTLTFTGNCGKFNNKLFKECPMIKTVRAKKGTYPEIYAENHGFAFEPLD